MKRNPLIAAFLAAALLLALTGCAAADTDPGTTEPAGPKIGLCVRQESDAPDYYQALSQTLEAAGYRVIVRDSHADQAQQLEQVDDLAAAGVSALIVEPVMLSEAQALIDQCSSTGLPVILLDSEPTPEQLALYEKLTYLGNDPALTGSVQVQLLTALLSGGDMNGDGTVCYAIVSGPEDHTFSLQHLERLNTALEIQAAELVTSANADLTADAGRAATAAILSQYGRDIEVILCTNDLLAVGAAQAVKNGGWVCGKDICVLGVGESKDIRDSINQGLVSGSAGIDLPAKQAKLLELLDALLANQPVEKTNYIGYIPVTIHNLAYIES